MASPIKINRLVWSKQHEWCLNEAQRRLKRSWAGGSLTPYGTPFTLMVRGQACILVDNGDGHSIAVRGYVQSYKPAKVVVVWDAGKGVDDATYCWEFGRQILWHSGVKDPVEQERLLNKAGVRAIKGRH